MFRASAKHSQVFPRPVTGGRKITVSRAFLGAVTGAGAGRCKVVARLLQPQTLGMSALSGFCNAATLATPSLASCACAAGGCGGVSMRDRARLSVAAVALLHIPVSPYGSMGYGFGDLQRGCNGRNGLALVRPALPASLRLQAIDNGRKSGLDGRCGGSEAGFGVLAARVVAVAGRRAELALGGADRGLALGGSAHGTGGAAGSTISRTWRGAGAGETSGGETSAAKGEQFQGLAHGSALVGWTGAAPAPAGLGAPNPPPPLRPTPTPKPTPGPHLPACRAAVASPSGGPQPAKLRFAGARRGPGLGQRGAGAGRARGRGFGEARR